MRCARTTYAEIVAAFDAGDLLRTHILRPTWHLVAAADLGWILAATSDRVHQRNAGMYRQTGIDADTAGPDAATCWSTMLAGGRSLTRPRSASGWRARGVEGTSGMRLTYLVMHAELDGLIVSGPLRGQPAHVRAGWPSDSPAAPSPIPEDPVAELWRRFVVGHGPDQCAGLRPLVLADPDRSPRLPPTAAARPARVRRRWATEEVWWDPAAPDADPTDGAGGGAAAAAVRRADAQLSAAQLPALRRSPAPARRRICSGAR